MQLDTVKFNTTSVQHMNPSVGSYNEKVISVNQDKNNENIALTTLDTTIILIGVT